MRSSSSSRSLTAAKDLLGYGLRQKLREGYTRGDFRADLLAALVVGVVALPLSMALAIACDVPPQHGLYTAIIAGVVCSLLGGTRFQVTGPTAAFVVILVPIVHKYGLGGLLVAGMMAGVMLVAHGARPARQAHAVRAASGDERLHDGHRDRDRRAPAQGRVRRQAAAHRGRVRVPRRRSSRRATRFNYWDVGIAGVHARPAARRCRASSSAFPAPLIALAVAAIVVVICGHCCPRTGASRRRRSARSSATPLGGGEVGHGIPPLPPLPIVPWQVADPGHPAFRSNLQVDSRAAAVGVRDRDARRDRVADGGGRRRRHGRQRATIRTPS